MKCRALCGVIQAGFKGEIHPINAPVGCDLSQNLGVLSVFSSGRDVEMIPVQLEWRNDVGVCVSMYHKK